MNDKPEKPNLTEIIQRRINSEDVDSGDVIAAILLLEAIPILERIAKSLDQIHLGIDPFQLDTSSLSGRILSSHTYLDHILSLLIGKKVKGGEVK
jgi:hypothetical protein